MNTKVIITGATGMVGEGVLNECLIDPSIEEILVINRRTCNINHPKLKEIIHNNFYDFTSIADRLKGYNACFFCMGVSSIGMNEEDYHKITYEITLKLANTLVNLNRDMVFCYVSGVGTDSTEKGRMMWGRVKGKTENHLLQLPFRKAYMFRPGFIQPTKGLKNAYKTYKVLAPLFPILKLLFPKHVCTLKEIGRAMINAVAKGYVKSVLEVNDIILLSKIQ